MLSGQSYSQNLLSVTGIVKDEESRPLELVTVTLNEIPTSTISDKNGEFKFSNIREGAYHITFSRTGFASETHTKEITAVDNTLDITMNKSLIETTTIDVTSSFTPTAISNSTFALTSINTRALGRIKNENLGSTIQSVPGVNSVSTGNNLGKPVIRGLTSQGVIIVLDGVKHESQQWGDEHSPEISLFDLDRIEILRGPSSLIYGADGIGGAINIISKPINFSNKNKPVIYGALDLNGYSVSNMGAGNISLGYGKKNFGLKAFIGSGRSGNVKTPDGSFTVNTITFDQGKVKKGTRTITGGELFNSGSKEYEGGLKFGYKGNSINLEGGFENFRREIELHTDPMENPSGTPNQKINTTQYELKGDLILSDLLHLEPVFSYETQVRKEFESIENKETDNAALHLELNNFEGDLRLHHYFTKDISGTAGISFNDQRNRSLAEEKLIPNFNSNSFGVYALEKIIKGNFSVSIGGRFDTKKLNTLNTDFGNRIVHEQSITFNSFSGSVGGVYKLFEAFDIFTNIGRGWRPPSEYELFVDGVHEGTLRYERGIITQNPDAQPKPESSLNTDIGVRFRTKKITGEISFFRNMINDFIYPSATSKTDSISGLPIFDVLQSKSIFSGYEYNLQIHPFDWLLITASGDYVRTENEATGNPIPFTPPAKNIFESKLQKSEIGRLYNPYISFSAKIYSPQNRVDPLEAETGGYTLLNAGAGFDFVLSKSIASVDLSVDNFTNLKYVSHLSRYRSYSMSPGRSFNLKFTMPFQF
ncbi:MAG: TonB-dependent receptor [bacterium]